MNTGDTGFMLICAAFVFLMTPGLAFFYGGLVRRKNVVNTMMACAGSNVDSCRIFAVLWWKPWRDYRRFQIFLS